MPDRILSDKETNQQSLNRLRTARAIEKKTKADAIVRLRRQTISGGAYDDKMVREGEITKK